MKKKSGARFLELLYGLFIIKDCLELVSKGKGYHIITISSQLRGIFLDTDGEKHKPLFFEVLDYFDLDPVVYIRPSSEEDTSVEGLVFKYDLKYPYLQPKETKDLIKISIDEWLNLPILRIEDKVISSKLLIGILSDKFGGAHYDPNVERWKWNLKNMQIFNVKIIDNVFVQLSELLLKLSWSLIRLLSNWSYCFEFGVRYENLVSPKRIISFYQGTSKMSVCFILGIDKSLTVKLVGPWGNSLEIPLLDKVDSNINSIGLNYYISTNFEYYLDIIHEGKICKHMKLPYPIFIDSRLFMYKTIIYGDDNLIVGIINQAQYMDVLNEKGTAELYQKFLEKRNSVDIFLNRVETAKENNYSKQNSKYYKNISYNEWLNYPITRE
jgi:hypothetical protein